jgi:hypothetical protein
MVIKEASLKGLDEHFDSRCPETRIRQPFFANEPVIYTGVGKINAAFS